MTPADYLADPAGRPPLVIDHPIGGSRLLADAWLGPDGALWYADTGWPEADGHPFHRVAGPIRPLGDPTAPLWRAADLPAGEVAIRPLWDWEADLQANWAAWQRWLASHPEAAHVSAAQRRQIMAA